MNVESEKFEMINHLFWMWITELDLNERSILDPVRAAAFGFYVARNSKGLDEWDVREFMELQIDCLSMFDQVQK